MSDIAEEDLTSRPSPPAARGLSPPTAMGSSPPVARGAPPAARGSSPAARGSPPAARGSSPPAARGSPPAARGSSPPAAMGYPAAARGSSSPSARRTGPAQNGPNLSRSCRIEWCSIDPAAERADEGGAERERIRRRLAEKMRLRDRVVSACVLFSVAEKGFGCFR